MFTAIIVVNLPTKGVTIDMNLYVNTNGENGEFSLFFTKHLDICQFFANPMSDPLANVGLQAVLMNKDNHVIEKCPIGLVSLHHLKKPISI